MKNDWIIKIGSWYLAHPRGQWEKSPDKAYGYVYKGGRKNQIGAEDEAKKWRAWMKYETSSAPGMLPDDGFIRDGSGKSAQVIRRKDALDLTQEKKSLDNFPKVHSRVCEALDRLTTFEDLECWIYNSALEGTPYSWEALLDKASQAFWKREWDRMDLILDGLEKYVPKKLTI